MWRPGQTLLNLRLPPLQLEGYTSTFLPYTTSHCSLSSCAHYLTPNNQGWAGPILLATPSSEESLCQLEALLRLVLHLALSRPDSCQALGCGAARALLKASAAAGLGRLHLLTPMLLQVRSGVRG